MDPTTNKGFLVIEFLIAISLVTSMILFLKTLQEESLKIQAERQHFIERKTLP